MSPGILGGEPLQRLAIDVIAIWVGMALLVAGHRARRTPRGGAVFSGRRDARASVGAAATVRAVHDVGQRWQAAEVLPAIAIGGRDGRRTRARAGR